MQYMENLSDRQAADAVRGRIDWKYSLSLPLGRNLGLVSRDATLGFGRQGVNLTPNITPKVLLFETQPSFLVLIFSVDFHKVLDSAVNNILLIVGIAIRWI